MSEHQYGFCYKFLAAGVVSFPLWLRHLRHVRLSISVISNFFEIWVTTFYVLVTIKVFVAFVENLRCKYEILVDIEGSNK